MTNGVYYGVSIHDKVGLVRLLLFACACVRMCVRASFKFERHYIRLSGWANVIEFIFIWGLQSTVDLS